jgi:hypothetical protein
MLPGACQLKTPRDKTKVEDKEIQLLCTQRDLIEKDDDTDPNQSNIDKGVRA